MPDTGTITLICCGNCAHDFGKEYRKALKELKRTKCFVEEMVEIEPRERSNYYRPKRSRKRWTSAATSCRICGCRTVAQHRIKWRKDNSNETSNHR